MNYIKNLEAQVENAHAARVRADDLITDYIEYLRLCHLEPGSMVSPNQIVSRLEAISCAMIPEPVEIPID